MLTPSEVEQYHETGQVTAAFRLEDDIVIAIQERAETLFAARPDLDHDYVPNMIETDPAGNWLEFGIQEQILDSIVQTSVCAHTTGQESRSRCAWVSIFPSVSLDARVV